MSTKSTNSSAIHHLALTASDLTRSGRFYDSVLAPVGYERALTRDNLLTWHGPMPEILLYKARDTPDRFRHQLYYPGLHHVAFRVDSRGRVDAAHAGATSVDAEVIDAPAEYPHYAQGYYAVFLLDPDGLKIEVAHVPVPTS